MAKILLVDDEKEFVEMLTFRLKKTGGYEVIEAFDGEDGLRLAQKKKPDVILLDIMMPKMDGREVMRRLKADANTAAIPIIILTASVSTKSMAEFAKLGAFDFIIKPFSSEQLIDKINKAIGDLAK